MAAHGECRNGMLCLLYANTCVYNYILCIIIHVLIFIDMNKTHCTTTTIIPKPHFSLVVAVLTCCISLFWLNLTLLAC